MDRKLILNAMAALNVTPDRLHKLRMIPFPEAVRKLESIKVEARKLYKQLAFKWHPDRNPDDPNVEDQFKALGAVLADLEKLRIQPPVQPPMMRFVYYPQASPFGSSIAYATTTTATTTTMWVKVV